MIVFFIRWVSLKFTHLQRYKYCRQIRKTQKHLLPMNFSVLKSVYISEAGFNCE